MKKMYFLAVIMLTATFGFGQGLENFNNSNATNQYADNSFVGENNITWTYVHSRDQNNDNNESGIDGNALMLRRVSNLSNIVSSSITGGIGNLSIKLYKGFTGGGDRQVEVFINGISKGLSTPFDDFDEHIFTIENIDIEGDIIIMINNVTAKQVIIDNISWTAFGGNLSNNVFDTATISLFPIPASNSLTFKSSLNKIGSFKVFNTSGQLMMSSKGNLTNNTLDVSKLEKGMYILKVSTDNKAQTYKFTK